ncbi:MAG: ydfK [Firmicutes bacterium]|nr:ydfK [Bacillota bacterium]
MKGTLVNAAAVLVGSGLGLALKQGIPKKYHNTLIHGMALAVGVIGLQMALKTQNVLIVILGIAVGAIVGEALNIDAGLNKVGNWLGNKLSNSDESGKSNIGRGFVTASLVYCIGAMAVVGSIQDGLTGDTRILYAKSLLDGIISIVFTSSMGIGVAFSSVSILIYQGSITLLAGFFSTVLSDKVVTELTATGGILIVGVSILMLELKNIKLANLLPAIPAAAVIAYFWPM